MPERTASQRSLGMALIRRGLLLASGAVLILGLTAHPVAASSQKSFHLEKTCAGFQCTVTRSSFRGIPAGTVISYSGNSPDALVAVINTHNGSATGSCNIASVFGTPSSPGRCTFDKGTGSLTSFHLDVAVTLDPTGLWHWDGTYRFGNRGCSRDFGDE